MTPLTLEGRFEAWRHMVRNTRIVCGLHQCSTMVREEMAQRKSTGCTEDPTSLMLYYCIYPVELWAGDVMGKRVLLGQPPRFNDEGYEGFPSTLHMDRCKAGCVVSVRGT